jgi:fused signal recognition particle receptor
MLKFWKKKPAGKDAEQPAAKTPADIVAPESNGSPLHEALAEIPAPADIQPDTERFAAPVDEAAAAPTRRSWRERLSGNVFSRSLGSLFVRNPKLDDELLDELETTLITADVGVEASTELVEDLRKRMHKREFADAPALLAALRQALVALLKPVEQPLDVRGKQPFVVLVVGINGAGKTTTIGKLARRWRDEKRALMLAAGDNIRAAAI